MISPSTPSTLHIKKKLDVDIDDRWKLGAYPCPLAQPLPLIRHWIPKDTICICLMAVYNFFHLFDLSRPIVVRYSGGTRSLATITEWLFAQLCLTLLYRTASNQHKHRCCERKHPDSSNTALRRCTDIWGVGCKGAHYRPVADPWPSSSSSCYCFY